MKEKLPTAPREPKPKRFPIRCIKCGAVEVRPAKIAREIEKNHDGRMYKLRIAELQVNQCGKCGEVYYGDDAAEQISAALREHLRLLSPEQIRSNLETLGLSQKDAAERLGIAPETLSRWLTGAMIQSRAMDNLMRAYFACPQVRENLIGEGTSEKFGASVVERPSEPANEAGENAFRAALRHKLRLASGKHGSRSRWRAISEQPEVDELMRSLAPLIALGRPRITRSFALWSRALSELLLGESTRVPEQSTRQPRRLDLDDSRLQRFEADFERLAWDLWDVPPPIRERNFRVLVEVAESQRNA